MNKIGEDKEIIDIFVTSLPFGFPQEEDSMLIKIIEEDGELSGIPEVHDSIFLVNRGKKQYYIDRTQKEFMFAHFIYEKNKNAKSEKKKKKSEVIREGAFIPAQLESDKKSPKSAKNKK